MAGKQFSDFKELSQSTKDTLSSLGFLNATPVQEATIPLFIGNKDVAVDACTGSGKTLAFIIPVIEKLLRLEHPLKRHQVGAVIISPTRELSRQIYDVAQPFAQSLPWANTVLLVGGTDTDIDVDHLKNHGGHIIIGTPGRIDDVLQRCLFLDLKSVEILILDEADRLLDMGFKNQIDSIMRRLPKQRRTGLFSATQTEAVEALARAGLRAPVRVNVAVTLAHNHGNDGIDNSGGDSRKRKGDIDDSSYSDNTSDNDSDDDDEETAQLKKKRQKTSDAHKQITPSTLNIYYTMVDVADKIPQLVAFLQQHRDQKIIVYFLTCACVDYYAKILPILFTSSSSSMNNYNSSSGNNNKNGNSSSSKNKHTNNNNNTHTNNTNKQQQPQLFALHGRMKQSARERTLSTFASSSHGILLATDVAARGLDIPDVHWVIQADPPQDPSSFVHRCGRTARMGRSGNALAYILPSESSYIEFLSLRKIPLQEKDVLPHAMETERVLSTLRTASERDRAVMESGTKAFVSYIRAYKEHHCKYIFILDSLPVGYLASSFALLRFPKMQELKKAGRALAHGELPGFEPSTVDIDAIKFKDRAREKQRQAMLKQRAALSSDGGDGSGRKKERGGDRDKKKSSVDANVQKQVQSQRLTASKRRQLEARQELIDLNDDYALLKKLKKGKITQKEYEKAAGLASDDDDSDGMSDDDDVSDGGDAEKSGKGDKKKIDLVTQALLKKAKKKRKKSAKSNA